MDPLDSTENQFLQVADARDKDALLQRLTAGASPIIAAPPAQAGIAEAAAPERPPVPVAAEGFLTPEQVAAEAAAQRPPAAPSWGQTLLHHVSRLPHIQGAIKILEADRIGGDYLKGLMAGTTEPVSPDQLVEKMAADRVKGPIPEGLTALDVVLQQPEGAAWAATMKTAAEFLTPLNAVLGGLRVLRQLGVLGEGIARPGGSQGAIAGLPEAPPMAPTRTWETLQDPLADVLAREGHPVSIATRTPKQEVYAPNDYQTAAQQAKAELGAYDAESGGYKVFTEADTGGPADVTGFKSTAPDWYKSLTGPLPAGVGATRLIRADVDAALAKFSAGEAPTTLKEQLIWDAIRGGATGEGPTTITSTTRISAGQPVPGVGEAMTKGLSGEAPVAQDILAQGRELELKSLHQQLEAATDKEAKAALQASINQLERQGANEQRGLLQAQREAATDPTAKAEIEQRLAALDKAHPPVTTKPLPEGTPPAPEAVVIGAKQVTVDFEALQTPEAIEQAKDALWKAKKADFGGAKGVGELERGTKPIPIEDAKLLAAWSRTTPEDLVAELRGQQVKMEEIYKNALFLEAAEQHATRAAAGYKAGTMTEDAFLDALTRYQAIGKATAGKGTDAAQTLRIMREDAIQHPLKLYRTAMTRLEKAGVMVGKDGEIDALADILLTVDKTVLADVISKPSWTDYLQELVYFSYLSNPATHAVNLTGSIFVTPLQAIMERQIAGLVPGSGVQATEALAMGRAWVSTMQNAWRAVGDSYRADGKAGIMELLDRVTQGQQSKLDRGIAPAFARQNVPEALRNGWLGSVAQGVGMLLRIPTKALQTEDALMRGLNYNMEVAAQAVRETAAQGLTDGAAIRASIEQRTANPSVKAISASKQFAAVQTFTDDLSRGGQGLQAFLQEHPLMKVSVAPFVKTPMNIAHYYWERTPILNFMAKRLREDLLAGGARAQLATAKIAMGAGLAAVAGTLAAGDYITGKGPSNPDTRKLWLKTHEPYAIKVGSRWVGYNRLDPIAMNLGETADAIMIFQEAQDTPTWEAIPEALIVANARVILSKTYVQGIAEYLNMIEDVARNPERVGEIMAKHEKQHASVLVPGLVAGTNRAFFEDQVREVNTALEAVEARVPGLSKTLKPKLDFFGDPILTEGWPGDLVSPMFIKRAKTDAVAQEMVTQQASPSMPPKIIEGIRLTSDEIHDLTHAFGKEATVRGLTLHEGLDALLHDQMGPIYTNKTDAKAGGTGKKFLIEDLVRLYREQAFKLFLDTHNDFAARYLEKLGTVRENLTGERPSTSRMGPIPPRTTAAKGRGGLTVPATQPKE